MIRNNRDYNKMICVLSVQNRAIYTEQNRRKEDRIEKSGIKSD